MKKETKKLVGFEEALVSNYRHYLEALESFATGPQHSDFVLASFGFVMEWNAVLGLVSMVSVDCYDRISSIL